MRGAPRAAIPESRQALLASRPANENYLFRGPVLSNHSATSTLADLHKRFFSHSTAFNLRPIRSAIARTLCPPTLLND